jgi:Mg-chelatase subunit ChlD
VKPEYEFREDPEAMITALLLGELEGDEAARVRQIIAGDPGMANLYERVQLTLKLVKETAATPVGVTAEQPAPLRLSAAKREALLAQFKTVKMPEPERKPPMWVSVVARIAALLVFLLFVLVGVVPLFKTRYSGALTGGKELSPITQSVLDASDKIRLGLDLRSLHSPVSPSSAVLENRAIAGVAQRPNSTRNLGEQTIEGATVYRMNPPVVGPSKAMSLALDGGRVYGRTLTEGNKGNEGGGVPTTTSKLDIYTGNTDANVDSYAVAESVGANPVLVGSPRRGDLGRLGEPSLPPMGPTVLKPDSPPDPGLKLDLRGASVDQTLNYLTESAGLTISRQTSTAAVPGTIDLVSATPLNKDEIVQTLNQTLADHGLTAIRNGNTLTVERLEEAYGNSLTPVIVNTDGRQGLASSNKVVTEVIPVHSLNPTQLIQDLYAKSPRGIQFNSSESGNAVVVTGTQADIRRLAQEVKALDNAAGAESGHTTMNGTSDGANPFAAFMGRRDGGAGGIGGGAGNPGANTSPSAGQLPPVQFTVDPDTGSIVYMTSDGNKADIGQMLAALDGPPRTRLPSAGKTVEAATTPINSLGGAIAGTAPVPPPGTPSLFPGAGPESTSRPIRFAYPGDPPPGATSGAPVSPAGNTTLGVVDGTTVWDGVPAQSGRNQIVSPDQSVGATASFQLKNADAREVANELGALSPKTELRWGASEPSQPQVAVTATGDISGNSVTVAASQDTLNEIGKIVDQMDANPAGQVHAFVYFPKSANPLDISGPLAELFGQQGSGSATTPQQNPFYMRQTQTAQQQGMASTSSLGSQSLGGIGGGLGVGIQGRLPASDGINNGNESLGVFPGAIAGGAVNPTIRNDGTLTTGISRLGNLDLAGNLSGNGNVALNYVTTNGIIGDQIAGEVNRAGGGRRGGSAMPPAILVQPPSAATPSSPMEMADLTESNGQALGSSNGPRYRLRQAVTGVNAYDGNLVFKGYDSSGNFVPQALAVAGSSTGVPIQAVVPKPIVSESASPASPKPRNQPADMAPAKPSVPLPTPQPEIQTRDNAFSTFSLNVSDVSFKLAATTLGNGSLPDRAAIRSEEFINAFDYRDSEPAPGAPIGFAWERAGYPFAHNRDLLRFSVKTSSLGRTAGRPLNLVLMLDKSGSMERADRVAIVRELLRVLAAQLHPEDRLSVVVFARTAQLWADSVPGDQVAALADSLAGITPEGGTNLEEAMKLAYATLLRHYMIDGENRVVVLTDGAANLGNVDPDALKKRAETNRAQGIALDCFGVGWEDLNDNLLETLSRAGGGRYGFINTPEDAATEFAGKLTGALRVAASDVKVQVEFNPARAISWRQIGYAKDQLTKEQFRDNTVKAAQLGAAEAGNGLYTVELNPAGDGPICTVHVRYRDPGTQNYHEHAWDVPYTGPSAPLDQASAPMRLAGTASAFSEWLAGNPYAAEVTTDRLQQYLRGVPEFFGADTRPKLLQTMIQEARSISGK